MEDCVAFFLSQKSSGEGAIRRTGYFALIRGGAELVFGILVVVFVGRDAGGINWSPSSQVHTLAVYWTIYDVSKMCVAAVSMLYMLCRRTKRYANYFYSGTSIVLHGTSIVLTVFQGMRILVHYHCVILH